MYSDKSNRMKMNKIDYTKAVNIAENVWWVGHYLLGDEFQCHVYLIENGDESVLFDPGSVLTFDKTLSKIESIIPFAKIKYFVCHHQDPDITGALAQIDSLVKRDDAVILSHWRAITLLKHYNLSLPFKCVEELGWTLKAGDLNLQFVFTPYFHFPGAFTTFDKKSGILFSSDIFGGFTDKKGLYAENEGYFQQLRFFHEHYMPSKEILNHSLNKFEQLPLEMICPQHGCIIRKELVSFMISNLKNVDCGIYTLTQTNTDIQKLSRLNKLLHDFLEKLVLHRDFSTLASMLGQQIEQIFPLKNIIFIAEYSRNLYLKFEQGSMFRAKELDIDSNYSSLLNIDSKQWLERNPGWFLYQEDERELVLPLFSSETKKTISLVFFQLKEDFNPDKEILGILKSISVPLAIAVEREIMQRAMDMERQKFYEQAIRDPLTNLYTRVYMNDAATRLFALDDRDKNTSLYVMMFDIDHFKSINDTFGHTNGDIVLKQVAAVLIEQTRTGDVQVRIGGEEFVLFMVGENREFVSHVAERIRTEVESPKFGLELKGRVVTISGGVTIRRADEGLMDAISRADKALYEAKKSGRNKIIFSDI